MWSIPDASGDGNTVAALAVAGWSGQPDNPAIAAPPAAASAAEDRNCLRERVTPGQREPPWGVMRRSRSSPRIRNLAVSLAKRVDDVDRLLVKKIPMARIDAANKVLGPRFITKYGSKQGVLVLGREIPLGIGAVIGGTGNALLGELTVRAARKAFGPARKSWDAAIGVGVDYDGDGDTIDVEIVDDGDEPSA
jgi:hypothetical protein